MKQSQATASGTPSPLMKQPLNWFFSEHVRHRQFCRLLVAIANAPAFDAAQLQRAIDFLRHDMPQHFIDEDEDLFPTLRRRALPGDELEQALDILAADHEADRTTVGALLGALESCLLARRPPSLEPAVKAALEAFASHELRHLALENAVVLPIARVRLTTRDLSKMASRLAARRAAPNGVAVAQVRAPQAAP